MSRRMEDMRRMHEDAEVVKRLEKRLGIKLGPPVRDLSHIPLLDLPGTPASQMIIEDRAEESRAPSLPR